MDKNLEQRQAKWCNINQANVRRMYVLSDNRSCMRNIRSRRVGEERRKLKTSLCVAKPATHQVMGGEQIGGFRGLGSDWLRLWAEAAPAPTYRFNWYALAG